MWDIGGTTGAAPIWAAVMSYLHKTQASQAPKAPAGVVQLPVQFAAVGAKGSGLDPTEAARLEWFLQGTQQTYFAMHSRATYAGRTGARGKNGSNSTASPAARITSPTTGTIIALDPDIPPNWQRVSFSAEGNNLRWLMDGKVFAKGTAAQWLPWPGRHAVQIVGKRGEVLDEVRLEVRGAGVKAPQASLIGKR